MCGLCKILRDKFRKLRFIFFGHMFLVVALLLLTFLGQLVRLRFSRELNTPYGLVSV